MDFFEHRSAMAQMMMDFAETAAKRAFEQQAGVKGSSVKADTTTSVETDLTNTALARRVFADCRIPLIIEEEDPRGFAALGEHICIDPLDGSGVYARSVLEWCAHAAYWQGGQPIFSVMAAPGLLPLAMYEGVANGFRNHVGTVLCVERGQMFFKPYGRTLALRSWIDPERTRNHKQKYLNVVVSPDATLPASYHHNTLRVFTSGSSVAAQAQVLLGQADAALFGNSQPLPFGAPQPERHGKVGAKTWDVLTLPHGMGYRWVHLNPVDWRDSVVVESLVPFVDEHFHLTGQFMLTHESLVETLLPRLAAQRAMLR